MWAIHKTISGTFELICYKGRSYNYLLSVKHTIRTKVSFDFYYFPELRASKDKSHIVKGEDYAN